MRIEFLSGPQESPHVKARGEQHGRSKLKEWQVNLMLDMFDWGYEPKYLSVVFSVALSTVYAILNSERRTQYHGRTQRTQTKRRSTTTHARSKNPKGGLNAKGRASYNKASR